MPHANHRHSICDAMNCSSSIVAYGNDTRGLQQDNELLEQFFAGSPFLRVVLPVSKRISGFMRVKGKDVPEEDASINVFQHAPYDRCSSLGYSASYSRPLCDQIEIPSLGVLAHVNVISQGYHAMLDSDKRWYLGSLAGLLKKWYALGHQGVAGSAIAALRELRLKGNQKGVAVSTMDPHDGPFTDIELESIQVALNRAYAAGALSTDDYLLSWLFMLLGQRPAQYALLKLSDFTVLEVGDGSLTYCLNVPRVKQRKPAKATWPGVVATVSINQVNNRLGPKTGSHHETIFSRYGFTEPDGSPIKVTTHQFRHYLNTLAQAGGLSQLDVAKWSGRKDIRQNATYDHVSADELVLKIRGALGDDSQMFGPLANLPKRIVIHRDEFARLKVPTAHTTEFGVCIHDYTMAPCQLHADCLNCSEQVCVKGDEVRSARIRDELVTARENLEAAKQAHADGYFGASRWVDHHELTVKRLAQLCALLDDTSIPHGAVIQLSNLPVPSRIEQAKVARAALTHRPEPSADASISTETMRRLMLAMEENGG